MGQSTDGIIAFGVDFGDDETLFPWYREDDNGDYDFDTWWAEQNGLPAPTVEYNDLTEKQFEVYWDKKHKLVDKCPVSLEFHCSAECPMYILAARGSVTLAYRGSPEVFKPQKLADRTSQYRAVVVAFCKKYKIKLENDPQWLLYSNWG